MKRIFIALGFFAVLFTLASCQKDQTLIRASITRYHGPEKVHLESNYACWDGNETVWINGSTYPIAPIDGDNAHFMINMGTTALTQGTQLNAVFCPSTVTRGTYSSDDNTIGITLPAIQNYSEDGNGNQVINAPMVTKATVNRQGGALLEFNNVCSLLKVQLRPNVICYWIEVTSDIAPLAGTGTLDIDDASLTMTGTTTTVRLNVNDPNITSTSNLYSRADGVYYIVLPPYTGSNLTVTVYDNPKTLMTFAQNDVGGHSLNKGEIGVINVNSLDGGRGIFSVSANEKVSFAPGNLTGSGPYSFTSEQYNAGDLYPQTNINTLSAAMGSNWFILSNDQWNYLLNQRPNAANLKIRATIPDGGLRGIILLPDNWSQLNCPVTVVDHNNFQGVEIENWDVVETYGAVFIPAEGMNGNYYWSTTTGRAVDFGNGNGQGGNGNVCGHTGTAYIRHAHYVVQGGSTTTED